ncbi:Aste57867_20580 [Aphanomyces stellatus]|uniref:Aste57867_20580 protein n=1 Tax=Aphanomyces stellatus TaxID=120398 RepID=A0A485LFE2_9STRA|nr:hypothetical protein As57867_020513 [Aphanomyces stellatus]VFT97261.1 Aste57867_20580 [Aphanomyces stellatus]
MATLRGYTLPFPIVEALDKLHFNISNNSIDSICDLHHALQPEDWDLLVDDGLSDSDSLLDDDDLLKLWIGTHDSSPSTPTAFTNSHRYILSQLSSSHDVTFVQEIRFRTPSLHDKVAYHWNRITNHEGLLFFEPPLYSDVPTSPATGGLATLIHPHSPLKDATEFPHENPTLRGRYLQIRCTLGALTIVLHNVYGGTLA